MSYTITKQQKSYYDTTIEFSDKVFNFLKEYQELCVKHGFYIGSEGESVEVFGDGTEDLINDDLWAVAKSTATRYEININNRKYGNERYPHTEVADSTEKHLGKIV